MWQRDPRVAPIETLRLRAHQLVADESPFVEFSAASQGFIETIEGRETLQARARAIRDEIAKVVAVALSECAGREPAEPDAYLAAALLVATWTVALIQGHRTFRQRQNTKKARAAFLAIVDNDIAMRKAKLDPKEFPILRQSGPILFDKFERRYKEDLDLILRGAR